MVHTISGGPTLAGTSNNSRKNHARKVPRCETTSQVFKVSGSATGTTRSTQIIFTEDDAYNTVQPHDDPMVVTVQVANNRVARVMIDMGSSVDIIFKDALDRCQLRQPCFYSCTTPLYGFTGDSLMPVGSIILPVAIGEPPKQVNNMVEFVVVDVPSAYNMILGRPFLSKIRGVLSIYHNVLKFPVDNEVGNLRGDQQMARKCYAVSSNPAALAKQCSQITTGDAQGEPGRVEDNGRVSPQETRGTPDSQPEQPGNREEPSAEDDEESPNEEVVEEEERGGPAEELEEVVVRDRVHSSSRA